MKTLTAVLFLGITPAQACHKYSIWHYPYPQRCGGAVDHRSTAPQTIPQVDKTWYVEITAFPPDLDQEPKPLNPALVTQLNGLLCLQTHPAQGNLICNGDFTK
jgi:hypothetical protein